MRVLIPVAVTTLFVGQAHAAGLAVKVEIPRLNVAEYHRPYVALWIESSDQSVAANLAVWYDVKNKDSEGSKWLKDLRQWWRRAGRDMTMPADGLSGATRPAGEHQLTFTEGTAPLKALAPGQYQLVVEAAREVGGRELLRVPFQWPPKAPEKQGVRGEHELGAVSIELKP